MKAAQFQSFGGPEVVEINAVEKPAPQSGQVLVAVRGAAINPFDYSLRSGAMKDKIPLKLPFILGGDFSGVVETVGPGVTEFQPGDAVYGSVMVLGGGSGALAEYAVANTTNISTKPASLNYLQSAAIVLVGVSAFESIDKLELAHGQKLLIHGGAGGIGSAAIQYAKHLGLYIVTTVREVDADFVRGLGADDVIDYETTDFTDRPNDFDGVFDTVGGETYQRSFKVLKPGGKLISMVNQPDQTLAQAHHVTALMQSTKVTTANLKKLTELVDGGIIVPPIDRTFSLDETPAAFEYLESGHHRGKVVIRMGKE